jgi:hypothetical protein
MPPEDRYPTEERVSPGEMHILAVTSNEAPDQGAGKPRGAVQRARARSTLTPAFSAIAYQRSDSA